MKLTVRKGENVFRPLRPTWPHFSTSLHFQFKLGEEWWEGPLTTPLIFGCKLPAIGKLNYHRGGMNWALIHELGSVYLYPRYYEMITTGTYKGHELSQYRVLLQPNTWYDCVIETTPMVWRLNNALIYYKNSNISHWWKCPPFLGASGRDTNYPNDNSKAAVAARDLTMELQYV